MILNEIRFPGSTTINFALISGIGMTLSLEIEGGIKKFYFFQRGCQKQRIFFETIAVRRRPPPPHWHFSQDILYPIFLL